MRIYADVINLKYYCQMVDFWNFVSKWISNKINKWRQNYLIVALGALE